MGVKHAMREKRTLKWGSKKQGPVETYKFYTKLQGPGPDEGPIGAQDTSNGSPNVMHSGAI